MNIEIKNLDNLTNEKSKVFVPKLDQDYYTVNGVSVISYTCNQWDIDNNIKDLVQLGNCFKTREEAEFALKKTKSIYATQTLCS